MAAQLACAAGNAASTTKVGTQAQAAAVALVAIVAGAAGFSVARLLYQTCLFVLTCGGTPCLLVGWTKAHM